MQWSERQGHAVAGDTVLIGAGGMLGTSWSRALGADAMPLDVPGFDLTRPEHMTQIPPSARLVINCAAYTDVDGAETDEERATAINGAGVWHLAERCAAIGATLVHYSTDYVFDGAGSAPYPVDHERAPASAYGRSKHEGERALEAAGADFLCVRTSWLYAAHGKNFVRTIAELCAQRESLRVVDDQRGRPTLACQLVSTTQALLAAGARGFYHGCDSGECTWYGFAQAIARRVNPACTVEPCATDEVPRPAPRPAFSVMDLSLTEAITGPIPSWNESLDRTLDVLVSTAPAVPEKG